MRVGLAIPLAISVLAGVLLGHMAPAGMLELLGVCLLLSLSCRHPTLTAGAVAMILVAVSLLLAKGADLPDGLSREDLAVEVGVLSADEQDRLTRLTVSVDDCRPLGEPRLPCKRLRRLRLSFYSAPDIRPGERWAMTVRLRPPSGLANPDTFDYRAWLWREGIQATGYVRSDPAARKLAAAGFSLKRWALAHLDERSLTPRTTRWLAALTLGAGDRLEQEDWDLLNASGTTHLMVISGLHVGLVAAFVLLVSRGLARLVTPGHWRLAVWPWCLAAVAAVAYASLAGLEPPAMRAMVMTLVGLWVASGRHAPGPWQGWWLALGLVLLLDPRSAWRPGLWLSFVAVALLILIWQGRDRPRGIRAWLLALVRSQLLLAPLMAAAVLLAFERLAPAAPLVNLIAVPLVSSLLVPLALLGWLLAWVPPLSALCWWLFGRLVDGLIFLMEQAVMGLPLWMPAPFLVTPLALSLGLMALLWALPGLAGPFRVAGSLVLVAIPISVTPQGPGPGELRVRVHDVGQGQLLELRTTDYRMLYDTGPSFASGFTPLASLWPPGQRFDDVIVSHANNDHAGGVQALLESHDIGRFLAPPGERIGIPFDPCRRQDAWQRDGVVFRLLWPPGETAGLSSNDRSCVLEVTAGDQRLLITGDAGSEIERAFLREVETPVTVLVAGHHGSRSSSGPQLVQWLAPRHAIFTAGRDNPFGHPHDEVVRRFHRAGTCLWNTAHDGALTFWMGREDPGEITTEGSQGWRRDGVGVGCLALESSD
jgi:competence protein ComEC